MNKLEAVRERCAAVCDDEILTKPMDAGDKLQNLLCRELAESIRALPLDDLQPSGDVVAGLVEALKAVIEANASYERYGATCHFEEQPMIHAQTLIELTEKAEAALAKVQEQPCQ